MEHASLPDASRGTSQVPPFQRVGIVGLGLIGGSIALAARQAWPSVRIVGVDRAPVLDTARRMRVIDEGGPSPSVLSDADLVILAAPVRQNAAVLIEVGRAMAGPAIVTDTGSTKRQITEAARQLPDRVVFVGGHPLAGAAVGGVAHARADLFKGRRWLFTPDGDADGPALHRLETFVRGLGAVPAAMGVDDHDRLLAFVSHLPQLAASALMDVVGEAVGEDGLTYAGRGLVDTTRLASSPPDIWTDIVATNSDQVGVALDRLIGRLQALRDDLDGGDRLTAVFESARRWRQALPK